MCACVCVCVCVCVDYTHLACVRMSMYSEYSCLYVLHVCLSHCPLQEFDTQKVQCIVCLCEESNLILKNYCVHVFSIIDCIMHGFIIC